MKLMSTKSPSWKLLWKYWQTLLSVILLQVMLLPQSFANNCAASLTAPHSWENLGLQGSEFYIFDLLIVDDFLYAGTSQGLYRKDLTLNGDMEKVEFPGLLSSGHDLKIISMAYNGNSLYVADSRDAGVVGVGSVSVVEIANPGAKCESGENCLNWKSLPAPKFSNETWGGPGMGFMANKAQDAGVQPIVYSLAFTKEGQLLAGGGTDAVSIYDAKTDSWEIFAGNGGYIRGLFEIATDPVDGSLWVGGQNAIEEGLLIHFSPTGQMINLWGPGTPPTPGFPKKPTVVEYISFHPVTKQMFVHMEGGLITTQDRFAKDVKWDRLINTDDTSRFVTESVFDPVNPDIIYATTWLKQYSDTDSQELFISMSEDGGKTWKKIKGPEVQHGGVFSIQVRLNEDGTRDLYLGGSKGGLWKVKIQ